MANHNEAAIEAEIQAKGKTAPRLTPDHISAQIASEYSARASDVFKDMPMSPESKRALSCLTICVIVLKNGFTLVGESACASPENFDADIGHKIARDNARSKIWALEGYALRSKLARWALTKITKQARVAASAQTTKGMSQCPSVSQV
jgi:hypothetical protein